jgi:hypothetical protein
MKLEPAPELLILDDAEKLTDCDGNIMEIETRGERDVNKCYFRTKDIGKYFKMKDINNSIIKSNSSYEKNIDYKYFTIKKNYSVMKIKVKKQLYFTYNGLVRCLYISKNKHANKFTKWATETLFTVQMGSKEEKEDLVSGVLGIPAKSLRHVLSTSSNSVPCIYRFALGVCKDLRKKMKLKSNIPDDHIIIKYGYTDNLIRRTKEHIKTYGSIKGVKLELMNYAYIDPKYLSQAEVDIKEFFADIETPIKYDSFTELVAINPKHEKQIKKQFKYITNEFTGCVKEMIDKIEDLKRTIVNDKLKIENMLKLHSLEIKNKDIIIQKQQIEIENRDLQMMVFKLQNQK